MSVLAELTYISETPLDSEADYEKDWFPPEVSERNKFSGSETHSPVVDQTSLPRTMFVGPPVVMPQMVVRRTEWTETMQQQWECIVLEVSDDVVACELHDLWDDSKPTEFAEVYLTEFSESDRQLLHEGTVFYWSVGYETRRNGQIKGFSTFRVRRIPSLTSSQKKSIAAEAAKLSGLFSAPRT
jgi:hypothetical protein